MVARMQLQDLKWDRDGFVTVVVQDAHPGEVRLLARRDASATKSYTRSLLDAGTAKIGAKVQEEAEELSRALQSETDERVISEAADVMYHVLVGLLARGVSLRDVEAELARRSGV